MGVKDDCSGCKYHISVTILKSKPLKANIKKLRLSIDSASHDVQQPVIRYFGRESRSVLFQSLRAVFQTPLKKYKGNASRPIAALSGSCSGIKVAKGDKKIKEVETLEFNSFKVRPHMTRYLRPSQLTGKLQDRKCEEGALKPDITILEALEDISDGEVSSNKLEEHAAQYICHDCQVKLRQAVNKKSELDHHIMMLNERFSQVSNKERRKYYREHYGKDKNGCCWGCMYQFVQADYQKSYSDRLHLASPIVDGMTIAEAINSLLEQEAEALLGLYEKKTYICRKCTQLLRNVVKTQCLFDILQTGFKSVTHENSVFARFLRGETVPLMLKSGEQVKHLVLKNDGSSPGSKESESSYVVNSLTDLQHSKSDRFNKRPLHKILGNLPAFSKKRKTSGKKRKLSKEMNKKEDEDGGLDEEDLELEEDFEIEEENSASQKEIVDLEIDSETVSEHCEAMNIDSGSVISDKSCHPSGVEVKAEIKNTNEKSYYSDLSAESSASFEKPVVNYSRNNEMARKSTKRSIHVKLSLQGDQIKALSVKEEKSNQKVDGSITLKCTDLENGTMSDDWMLYYYPNFAGRAEFVRLVFEEAGIPYKDCGADIKRLIIDGEMEGYPHFAPPMVKKGNLQLSQTPVICRYLGEEFGLYPDSLEDRLHAEQINQCCHDYIAEGRLSFHGINPVGPYLSQKVETQPYIDRFVSERLPRWLKYFERVLAANKEGTGFLFGDKISYCDLSLFHIIHATESQFPDAFKAADYIPLLKSFKERIASRPRIAEYLRSERWRGFSGDSMM